MIPMSKRWTASKVVAAAAWALVAVATGIPRVDAMFSSSSDVVQARRDGPHRCVYSRGRLQHYTGGRGGRRMVQARRLLFPAAIRAGGTLVSTCISTKIAQPSH